MRRTRIYLLFIALQSSLLIYGCSSSDELDTQAISGCSAVPKEWIFRLEEAKFEEVFEGVNPTGVIAISSVGFFDLLSQPEEKLGVYSRALLSSAIIELEARREQVQQERIGSFSRFDELRLEHLRDLVSSESTDELRPYLVIGQAGYKDIGKFDAQICGEVLVLRYSVLSSEFPDNQYDVPLLILYPGNLVTVDHRLSVIG